MSDIDLAIEFVQASAAAAIEAAETQHTANLIAYYAARLSAGVRLDDLADLIETRLGLGEEG